MGRTYEALQWAEKEYEGYRLETLPQPLAVQKSTIPRRARTATTLKPYEDLKANLLARYPLGSMKTILFTSVSHGMGASTTAVNFAITLARNGQSRVLLVDADLRTPKLHDVFKIDYLNGLSDFVADGSGLLPCRVGSENLDVIPSGRIQSDPVSLFGSKGFDKFLKRVRESYDFIVLDAPPIHGFPDSRALCGKVDGVVLVMEAGKTRQQAALSAKRQLEEAGGKILGVVLNKRKFYIPEFIYRRL